MQEALSSLINKHICDQHLWEFYSRFSFLRIKNTFTLYYYNSYIITEAIFFQNGNIIFIITRNTQQTQTFRNALSTKLKLSGFLRDNIYRDLSITGKILLFPSVSVIIVYLGLLKLLLNRLDFFPLKFCYYKLCFN